MGIYINKGNEAFRVIRNSEYVDKTGMISEINKIINTESQFCCVTRCRRFGKSMAAKMLCAYYDYSCDSHELFQGLQIENDASFEQHLNKYPVVYIDVTDFTTRYRNDENIVNILQNEVKEEVANVFSGVPISETDDLMAALIKVKATTNQKFFIIIDEWDAILREFDKEPQVQDNFVDLLRRLFKGSSSSDVFACAYLTGILPIKKYNTQSALNNFEEYSMVDPANLAPYFGFTPEEVQALAEKFGANKDELRNWYDGYKIGNLPSIYNPYSVMKAVRRGNYTSYWATTGAYDAVSTYIQMNYDGLKDDIIRMLGGERCGVNTTTFNNDMHDIRCKDDVFTVLIHLGYLSYDAENQECYIPNKEVSMEFTNAVRNTSWTELVRVIQDSRSLLDATLDGDADAVARGLDRAHNENTSILSYNNENSLACVISIAYIYARNNYIFHREYATGKGFADVTLIPRKNFNSPALVIELKYNNSADTAIGQIKRKQYPTKLAAYSGDILLVGVNYDRQSKEHTCRIEKFEKIN